jgi:predicted dehydrogenase
VTQLGNQGSATPEFRRAVEVLATGLIGAVSEVHVWTGRPVWPQGVNRPEGSDPVPASLDWDLWLGGAPVRPYKSKVYHRFNWRGWHDFGTGALGDAGSHLMNLPFRVLGLGGPVSVEAEDCTERFSEAYPKASKVRLEFAARDKHRPPVTLWWHDGNWKPAAELMPQVVAALGQVPGSGCLLVGEQGVWLVADDSGTRHYLALRGEERAVDFERHEACQAVPESLPRVQGQQREFLDAIRSGGTPFSTMAHAVPLAESVLAGCVAQRIRGKLEWNSRKGRFSNNDEANRLAAPEFRAGWAYLG